MAKTHLKHHFHFWQWDPSNSEKQPFSSLALSILYLLNYFPLLTSERRGGSDELGFIFRIAFWEKRYQQKEQSLILNAGRLLELATNQFPCSSEEETEAKEVNNPGCTLSSSFQTSHLRTGEMLKATPSVPPFTCITNFPSTLIGKLLHTESCAQEEAKVYPAGINGFTENKEIL